MTVFAATTLTLRTLLDIILSALAAGIGVTVAFSAVIYCADRASELRRSGRTGVAAALSAGGVVALGACVALVVYGLVLVTSKGT